MEAAEDLSGVKKAAILLLTMDEDLSKEIIKDLDDEDIEAVGQEISKLRIIPGEVVHKVHDEFTKRADLTKKNMIGMEDKFKLLVQRSLGIEKAEMFLGNIEARKSMPGEFLRTADAKMLANVLRGEHPQTIALVLSMLNVKKAHELVSHLPDKVHYDVLTRMAYLEKVDRKIIKDVENVLREQLETSGTVEGKQLGGVEAVAGIINQMDRKIETELLTKIEEHDAALAEKIRMLMFTFEDILRIEDRGMQTLLKEVTTEGAGSGAQRRIRRDHGKDIQEHVGKGLRYAEGRHGSNGPRPPLRRRAGAGQDSHGSEEPRIRRQDYAREGQ